MKARPGRLMPVVLALLAAALSGCGAPGGLFFEPPPVTPPAQQGTPEVTATAAPRASDTPLPPTALPCAYAWTSKDLPDETALVQDALQAGGLGGVEAALSAYGENCLDTSTDKIVSFNAMQTDFFFSIPQDDLNNRAEMGAWAEKLLAVVARFPPGEVPGANSGYVALVYGNGRDEVRLWFTVRAGEAAIAAGLSGEALFDELSTEP